jgi:hypothetical protein
MKTARAGFAVGILLILTAIVAVGNPPDTAGLEGKMEVKYAIVPRSALPIAITGADAALAEEARWLKGIPAGSHPTTDDAKFCIVVFVRSSSPAPVSGTLRIWLPGYKSAYKDIIVASPEIKRQSIYVSDGGLVLMPSMMAKLRWEKHFEWQDLHYVGG